MTIAFAADHGSTVASAGATTIAHTTTSAVASNRRIIGIVCWFGVNGISSVAGGGLTWVVDVQGAPSGSRRVGIISADAPSGLASGTTITVTFVESETDRGLHISSWSGIVTGASGYVGVSGTQATTSPNWSSGNRSIAAGSMLLNEAHEDSSGDDTATPTAPAVELCDLSPSVDDFCAAYRIESSAGTVATAGTWSAGGGASSNAYVEYLEASSGTPVTREWQLSYNLIAPVTREWQLLYNLIAPVVREWVVSYNLSAPVTREWQLWYDLIAPVSREWELSYSIADGTTPVTREWQLAYNIVNAVSREWELSYNLVVSVVREWAVTYNLSAPVTREWQLNYSIEGAVEALIAELVSAHRPVWQPDQYTLGRRR